MRFYIGSYTRLGGAGVSVCEEKNGRLTLLSSDRTLENPIWVSLSPDETKLYALGHPANAKEDALLTYRVDGDALTPLSCHFTGGRAACHLTLSADGKHLYAVNYLSGTVAVFPLTDGVADPRIQLIERHGCGPRKDRQESSHPHQCSFRPETEELFVCDLGMDLVAVYLRDPDSGRLRLSEEIVTPPAMGPRHLTFAGSDRFYLIGELDSMVRKYDRIQGVWQLRQEISALPQDFTGESIGAAIRIRDGKLYVTNRGHDSLCSFHILQNGDLEKPVWQATDGQTPRDFNFTPEGAILFAHQDGGGVTCTTGGRLPLAGAVCVCVAGA